MNKFEIYEDLLNLSLVKITDVKMERKVITIECQVKRVSDNCPNCHQASDTVNQYYCRILRDLNMSIRHVHLHIKMRQFYCQSCNRYYSETLDFADLNKEHTHRKTAYVFCLARKQSYTEVEKYYRIREDFHNILDNSNSVQNLRLRVLAISS
jgi:transposase